MIMDEGSGIIQSELLCPLSVITTALSTPKVDRSHVDEGDAQTDIDLFPSLHPSIEDESGSAITQTESAPDSCGN